MSVDRRQREQEIVRATRELWDERGVCEAPVDEVARRVGINRALVYRHFASREELHLSAVCDYLDELAVRFHEGAAEHDDPVDAFAALVGAFADYGLEHPAFPEAALTLMRRPASELRDAVSEGTWLRVGRSMGSCLGVSARVLRAGKLAGAFRLGDADLTANLLYANGLGTLHLASVGIGIRELQPGTSVAFPISPDDVRRAMVEGSLAFLGVSRPRTTAAPGTAP